MLYSSLLLATPTCSTPLHSFLLHSAQLHSTLHHSPMSILLRGTSHLPTSFRFCHLKLLHFFHLALFNLLSSNLQSRNPYTDGLFRVFRVHKPPMNPLK